MDKKEQLLLEIEISKNQQETIQLSKSTNSILIIPFTIGGGNIEHYYHFIFDLLLPLNLVLNRTSSNVIFSIKDFGILTSIVLKLFKNRINILSDSNDLFHCEKINLIGMNPNIINIDYLSYRILRKSIFSKLDIKDCNEPSKILLIERLPPNSYFLYDAQIKGSGSSRRSIKNHNELKSVISATIRHPYKFQNIQLEKMPFEDQVKNFNTAAVVIGQHGAGLSNVLWMRDESVVIEFGHMSQTHFKKISSMKKHHYFLHDYNTNHIKIDCQKFTKWLSQNSIVSQYFLN